MSSIRMMVKMAFFILAPRLMIGAAKHLMDSDPYASTCFSNANLRGVLYSEE
jgi:hypothetical protein